ncbi:site-specific integrase [Nonomuraea sp. NPDC049504]|uniref:tyrosine-type recombinase/integrase n=1 Tax=Nonomuraea sp. NPDC049504 TaxID=3154729 RepID=UPI0034175AA6
MAHVKDLWFKSVNTPGGKPQRVPTKRNGKGKRWLAVWIDLDGRQQTKAFAKKTDAERHLNLMEADKARGNYIDPNGAKTILSVLAKTWLESHTADPSTRTIYEGYWRVHIAPRFGGREIGAIRPSDIRAWLKQLERKLAPSTAGRVLALLDQLLGSAVEDGLISKNPCAAKTVKAPELPKRKIRPWPRERVLAVRDALPERYRILATLGAGCGLRQGEIFGLAVDDVDVAEGVVHVRQQVKQIRGRLIFGLPKHDYERDIPLPASVAAAVEEHLELFPAREVTLPWEEVDGEPRTFRLILTSRESKPLNRNYINEYVWKRTLERLGIIPKVRPKMKETGRRDQSVREYGMHALRHYYASVLLDAGESIKALAEYLGHQDPGFTLRTYTHLLPGSVGRTRKAIDEAFGAEDLGEETEE